MIASLRPGSRQGSSCELLSCNRRDARVAVCCADGSIRNQEKADIPLAEIGYRWLQHHSALSPFDGIIVGSSTPAHLKSNMASVMEGPLPEEVVSALDAAYRIVGHDAPRYWR
jgi:aryl-alcohol dehydrogenase-like predicted oxidoreductase